MNRRQSRAEASWRRSQAKMLRARASEWPERLEEVPREQWPARRPEQTEYPVRLWRSRHYLVQEYATAPWNGIGVRRLSVNRTSVDDRGDWSANIPWEDLQEIKRQTGHADWYAVEIFPRDRDVVNVANLRHLWLLSEPLGIGWFETNGEPP